MKEQLVSVPSKASVEGAWVRRPINQKGRGVMMILTPETREKARKVAREQREAAKQKAEGLTCSEAEVEAILSEGEST